MNELHSTINKIIQNTIDNNDSFRNLFKQSDNNCIVPEGCQIINFDEECSNSFYNCASPYQGYNNPNVEENNEFDSLNTRITELQYSISSPAWKNELDQHILSLQNELDDIEDKLNNSGPINPDPTDPDPTDPDPTDPDPTNPDPTNPELNNNESNNIVNIVNQNELILQNSNCISQIGCKNYMPTPNQPSCSPSPEPALCLEASPGYIITNGIVSPSPTSVQNQSSETNNENNSTPSDDDDDNTTRNIIIGIVVTILLGGIGYIIMKKTKMNEKLRYIIQEKKNLAAAEASLRE